MLLFYKINLSYTLLSQYRIVNAAKLIENADTRLSVKYLFTKNIILRRAVREDNPALDMSSLSKENIHRLSLAGPPGLQTRSRDLTHMQLFTRPINPRDPCPADICHGRNRLVHGATVNAVPVRGRDTAAHFKSRADGDAESVEFIMRDFSPRCCSSSSTPRSPPGLWQSTLHLKAGLPSGPMPGRASETIFFGGVGVGGGCFVVYVNFR